MGPAVVNCSLLLPIFDRIGFDLLHKQNVEKDYPEEKISSRVVREN